MAKRPTHKATFSAPTWLYKGNVGRLFDEGETMPAASEGYTDTLTADPDEQARSDAASAVE